MIYCFLSIQFYCLDVVLRIFWCSHLHIIIYFYKKLPPLNHFLLPPAFHKQNFCSMKQMVACSTPFRRDHIRSNKQSTEVLHTNEISKENLGTVRKCFEDSIVNIKMNKPLLLAECSMQKTLTSQHYVASFRSK